MSSEGEKPKVEVKENGRLVVDLSTIPDSTLEDMKKTAKLLRRRKQRLEQEE